MMFSMFILFEFPSITLNAWLCPNSESAIRKQIDFQEQNELNGFIQCFEDQIYGIPSNLGDVNQLILVDD